VGGGEEKQNYIVIARALFLNWGGLEKPPTTQTPPATPAQLRSRLHTKSKRKSPTQLSRAPAFLGVSSVPPSAIALPRNTVVHDTQERLGIENNVWDLLIAETLF